MIDARRGRRVAIIAGVRTPFAKSGTVFADVSAVALARHAARELLFRSEVDGRESTRSSSARSSHRCSPPMWRAR